MMIKNERQYRITKAQAAKLVAALESFSAQSAGDRKTHPRLVKAQADALRSQLESLRGELREYEIAPEDFGLIPTSAAGFLAADANEAMEMLRSTLAGGTASAPPIRKPTTGRIGGSDGSGSAGTTRHGCRRRGRGSLARAGQSEARPGRRW